ncbi:MAG: hypothetical protein ABGZ35_10835 [Planctomycetaceae bacterium]
MNCETEEYDIEKRIFVQRFAKSGDDAQTIFEAMQNRTDRPFWAPRPGRFSYETPIVRVHSEWDDADFLTVVANEFHQWQVVAKYDLGIQANDFKVDVDSSLCPAVMPGIERRLFASLVFYGYFCENGVEFQLSDWIDDDGEIRF